MGDRNPSRAGGGPAGSSLQGGHGQTEGETKAAGGRPSIPASCNAAAREKPQTHVLKGQPSGARKRLELHLLRLEEVEGHHYQLQNKPLLCEFSLFLQQAQLSMEDAGVDAFLERGAWCQMETDLLQQKICHLAASIDAQLKAKDDE